MFSSKTMRTMAACPTGVTFAALHGCASHDAYRTEVVDPRLDRLQCHANSAGEAPPACAHRTPEVADGKYELHFVEFDDRGWVHPQADASADAPPDRSAVQIDALMDDLKENLRDGKDLKVILFIHGWKHDASKDDDNVMKFRRLLERAASYELYQQGRRQVIRIYVGWRGKPWLVPDPVLDLSFWSRKDTAARVNPAFEASRFEALYRVANRQTHRCYVPPMFMSITSVTDDAAGVAFPAGRFFNTIFERPTSSGAQAKAIKQTPGHGDVYVTHLLHGPDPNSSVCRGWTPGDKLLALTGDTLAQTVKTNKQLEVAQSKAFAHDSMRKRQCHPPGSARSAAAPRSKSSRWTAWTTRGPWSGTSGRMQALSTGTAT